MGNNITLQIQPYFVQHSILILLPTFKGTKSRLSFLLSKFQGSRIILCLQRNNIQKSLRAAELSRKNVFSKKLKNPEGSNTSYRVTGDTNNYTINVAWPPLLDNDQTTHVHKDLPRDIKSSNLQDSRRLYRITH